MANNLPKEPTKEELDAIENNSVCKTCGGTKEISVDENDGEGNIQRGVGTAPCPDCKDDNLE